MTMLKGFLVLVFVAVLGAWYVIDTYAQVDNSRLPIEAAYRVVSPRYMYYLNTSNYVYETVNATQVLWTRCSNSVINVKTNVLYP